ncbi:MAG: hypothetical protein H0Z39_04745 [Peptococcaceae bacterium]|nr:hypothetical protein [Peptococcaceae bacterium]
MIDGQPTMLVEELVVGGTKGKKTAGNADKKVLKVRDIMDFSPRIRRL